MPRPTSDPSRWLADLMEVVAGRPAASTAAAPWTTFVADAVAWQTGTVTALVAPWLTALPGAGEPIADKRFAGEAWSKRSTLRGGGRVPTSRRPTSSSKRTRHRARWTRAARPSGASRCARSPDALSPANILATNPEAMQLAMETGGASLIEGLRLFTEDLAQGRISMTDDDGLRGRAQRLPTPGTVVFQNELIQLIQYTPTTEQVYERPLVIVPPCINKYYILDLQPANSFVASRSQGHTVFLVSWRNAGPGQADADLGRLPRAGRAAAHRRRTEDHPAPTRSTPSVSASVARCWPARWRCCAARASTRWRA